MIERLTALRCDLCAEHWTGLSAGAWAVRSDAEKDGWVYVKGTDVCPKCADDPIRLSRVIDF